MVHAHDKLCAEGTLLLAVHIYHMATVTIDVSWKVDDMLTVHFSA